MTKVSNSIAVPTRSIYGLPSRAFNRLAEKGSVVTSGLRRVGDQAALRLNRAINSVKQSKPVAHAREAVGVVSQALGQVLEARKENRRTEARALLQPEPVALSTGRQLPNFRR